MKNSFKKLVMIMTIPTSWRKIWSVKFCSFIPNEMNMGKNTNEKARK